MVIVKTPTESELHLASHVGVLRQICSIRNNFKGRYGCEDRGFKSHVDGAICEMMLAEHLDLFWNGTVGDIKAADVGGCYQVRGTDLSYGNLITHPKDNDNQPFILARLQLPEVHLVGWSWGHEAKQEKFWRQKVKRPAYFSPTFHDMTELPDRATVKARGG